MVMIATHSTVWHRDGSPSEYSVKYEKVEVSTKKETLKFVVSVDKMELKDCKTGAVCDLYVGRVKDHPTMYAYADVEFDALDLCIDSIVEVFGLDGPSIMSRHKEGEWVISGTKTMITYHT